MKLKKPDRTKLPYNFFLAFCAALLIAVAGSSIAIVISLAVPHGFDLVHESDNYSRMIVSISAKEADIKKKSGALFIDASLPEQFSAEHIDGAINVPWEETPFEAIRLHAAEIKNAPEIILYDSSFSPVNLKEMASYFLQLEYDRHVYIFDKGLNYWKIGGYDAKQ